MVVERVSKTGEVSFLEKVSEGKRRVYHKTFKSKLKAQEWTRQERANNRRSCFSSKKEVTAKEYFSSFIDSIESRVERASVSTYRVFLRQHISPVIKNKKMEEVTFSDALSIQKAIIDKGRVVRLNNSVLSFFQRVLKYASSGKGRHRVIESYPLDGFKMLPEAKKEMLFWVKEEVDYFFNHEEVKKHYYYDFMRVAVNTGMKPGEIAALQVSKIDFSTNTITVSSIFRRKENGDAIDRVKGPFRYLKMNPVVREIMEKKVREKSDNDLIFETKKGAPVIAADINGEVFKPLQRKVGMKKIICFYDLRHTFASNYFISGGSLIAAREMLGHRNLAPILAYARISEDFKQLEANRIEI